MIKLLQRLGILRPKASSEPTWRDICDPETDMSEIAPEIVAAMELAEASANYMRALYRYRAVHCAYPKRSDSDKSIKVVKIDDPLSPEDRDTLNTLLDALNDD